MKAPKDEYVELLRLTREYLLQEYQVTDRILADRETYSYFRNFVSQRIASSPATRSPNVLQTPISSTSTNSASPPPPVLPHAVSEQIVEKHESSFSNSNLQPAAKPVKDVDVITSSISKANQTNLSDVSSSINPGSKISPEKVLKNETDNKVGSIFVPEPPSPYEKVDLSEMRRIVSEKNPSLRFLDDIPSDAEAKKKARSWEIEQLTQVLILSFSDDLRINKFLENLSFAVELYGWSAKIVRGKEIEKSKKWNTILSAKGLHLIIAASGEIEASVGLKNLLNEDVESSTHTLAQIPLLLLKDFASYLLEPNLKSVLWKTLKENLTRP